MVWAAEPRPERPKTPGDAIETVVARQSAQGGARSETQKGLKIPLPARRVCVNKNRIADFVNSFQVARSTQFP
jgi:hypothetical protein